eukprot:CAMPEP_0172537538 /NCGR_PEP_ID=MMETSP1067-20121228/9124_1 /TAXON_ID=265564 ORGANISM="Thalassiosira punctigera, Strain Tpunct2005C2" /NCGR_SAMPLE_ID=MMETSP1067 /ASSEMBLY_ACC=CAM_ASM_000444 /LENGTH=218 /DNA_ID=CAMNT_0013322863 /DNA_START=65 /DNA_END=717 /DNA_ORIENTATION=+
MASRRRTTSCPSGGMLLPAIIAIALLASAGGRTVRGVAAFAPLAAPLAAAAACASSSRAPGGGPRNYELSSLIRLQAQNYGEEEYDDEEEEEEEDGLDALRGKKLGINIGAQLPSLTPEEIADIRAEAQKTLDAAVDSRLAEIEDLRREMEEDLAEGRKRMETAAQLNVQFEKQNLMEKIDKLSNEFLNKNEDFREATKKAADADKRTGITGRGLDWG